MTLILKKCMQDLICTQNPLECAAFRLSKCLSVYKLAKTLMLQNLLVTHKINTTWKVKSFPPVCGNT